MLSRLTARWCAPQQFRRWKSINTKAMASSSIVSTSEEDHGSRLTELRAQLETGTSPQFDYFIQANTGPNAFNHLPKKTIFEEESYYEKLRLPTMEATTINPEAYRSQEYYEVEQQRVFAESWQVVGYTANLQSHGDTIVTRAAGQPIFISRGKDNVIRGFYNACRHRGARLVSKDGRYPVISCPYHRWGYALDGRLLATPMWKGDGVSEAEGAEFGDETEPHESLKKAFSTDEVQNFNKKDYGLLPIRIETWGPYVYANVSGTAPPLESYLGDLTESVSEYPLDELVSYKSSKINVNANWKLLAENFMEYYHLPAVHPELCNVSAVDDHHRAQGKGMYVGFVTYPLTRGGTALDTNLLPAMEGITGKNKETAWFHTHFPNAFYFLLPHGLFSVIIEPTGPNTSVEHANFLVHPNVFDAPNAEKVLDEMWDFYDLTNNQDLTICEEVQIGIGAKSYKGGRMTFRFEETIHRYQNMLADYMTNSPRIPEGDESPPHPFQQ